MRKLVLITFATLTLTATQSSPQSPTLTPEQIQKRLRDIDQEAVMLRGQLPIQYKVAPIDDGPTIFCSPSGNVFEWFRLKIALARTALQLYHPDGRPKLCDPKTGFPTN